MPQSAATRARIADKDFKSMMIIRRRQRERECEEVRLREQAAERRKKAKVEKEEKEKMLQSAVKVEPASGSTGTQVIKAEDNEDVKAEDNEDENGPTTAKEATQSQTDQPDSDEDWLSVLNL